MNPAQVIEAALGKVAAKTGQPFKIKDFDNDKDLIEFAQKELEKNGLTDTEDLVDPETGRKIAGVLTGNRFFMKLHHTAESKGQGRATGGYTAEGTPAKGGSEGAKRVEGVREAVWILLDFGEFVAHVFHTDTRSFYDLERLWSDVPRLDWVDPDAPTNSTANGQ